MKLKDRSGYFPFVFLEKPLYEVCLIRITEQVGEKITVCTHGNADFLLQSTSINQNKTNMLSIKHWSILMTSVAETFLWLKQYICPFPRQGSCIYVGHYFV